jgi:formimidoylglutamate deiminase
MAVALRLEVEHLHQPSGWLSPGFVEVEADGRIAQISATLPPGWDGHERISGFVLPGMANLHSHAFQRGLVGRTERNPDGRADSFWTWRALMYRLAARIDPESLAAIATQLYVELLEAGYTSVGEFHYLHHDQNGRPYGDPTLLSQAILEAATNTGLGLCHLPVYYQSGGFDRPADPLQARFLHPDPEVFLRFWQLLQPQVKAAGATLGVAPHSLRAVPEAALFRLLDGIQALDPEVRVHLHIAEQEAEVAACLAHHGQRPVAWLLGHAPVGRTWCLVHATQLAPAEIVPLAKSGAVVGLCPTTEANLGDGIFPGVEYLEVGGRFGIGSDSHASVGLSEELRLFEYGQRLRDRRRNLLGSPGLAGGSVGRRLYDGAVAGGAQALGRGASCLAVGEPADLIRLDPEHPRLLGHGPDTILDAWIFGSAEAAIRDVWVGGRRVVREGRHFLREKAARAFREVVHRALPEASALDRSEPGG